MTATGLGVELDLRRAPSADVRAIDFRSTERDLWLDESALWDRLVASWAGLDDAAWRLPGAARSDAGGPDWSLAEHVGHLADWQELATAYIEAAGRTGRWPSDDDFDGGDFDRFNERRRQPWDSMTAAAIVDRLVAARARLLATATALDPDVLRGDDAWGWVYMVLHGHYLDHLAVIEPWADRLRTRQADGDPFVDDPRARDHADLRARDAAVAAMVDASLRTVPPDGWTGTELTPGWTLQDHVGHLADWAAEGTRAIATFRQTGTWAADPDEGIDAWNERQVGAARARSEDPAATLARYDAGRAELLAAVDGLSVEELRSPDGWAWVYDCLYGHDRKHLAMLGPWCARVRWPG